MALATVPGALLVPHDISLKTALGEEHNLLQRWKYPGEQRKFLWYVYTHRHELESLVAGHLGLQAQGQCRVSETDEWIHGSFNLCVPIYWDVSSNQSRKRMMIRFPLPYKLGESNYPGNADEKLRCEVATYIWIQDNCPNIPTPQLWGFGFSNGQSFTALENVPTYAKWTAKLRRWLLSLFGYPLPCRYFRYRSSFLFTTGYWLIDYIESKDANMLSESWTTCRHDKNRRYNLFRSLSRITLSLFRMTLPRIGAFTINDKGVVSLTNRPLTLRLHQLENEGIPTGVDRATTYTTVEPYLLDLLACQDNRLRYQPNAVNSEDDCRAQMAALAGLRSVLHHFIDPKVSKGPFILTLTDLHQSNIFVDDDWNIKFLIDLEWACALTLDMQRFPYWMSDQSIDSICSEEELAEFNEVREEFMSAFEAEEELTSIPSAHQKPRSLLMSSIWESGKFWVFHALDNYSALSALFWQHIQPMFSQSHVGDDNFDRMFSCYWSPDAERFTSTKIADREEYDGQLRRLFEGREQPISDDNLKQPHPNCIV